MLNAAELRACMARKGVTQKDVAKIIGVTPKTFYEKMRKGVFGTDEVQIMIEFLSINDPLSIFFAQEVTQQVTVDSDCMACTRCGQHH